MFPHFLPQEANFLTNRDSIDLAHQIRRCSLTTTMAAQDIATAYIKLGTDKAPILLLHGFDSSLLEFRRLIPYLTENQTWAIDLLGFGFTERLPNLIYSADNIREHLACFWRGIIKRPVTLVGVSMGGAAAIDFTLSYPEAVSKLVLINSVGYNGSFPIGRVLPQPIVELGTEFWRQRKIQSLFFGKQLGLLDEKTEDVIRCAALPSFMPNWELAMNSFTSSGGYDRLSDIRIALVDKTTLILWGEKDDVLGTDAADKFARAISGSRLVWLPKMGHSPQWSHPEAIAAHILQFMKDAD